MARDPRTDGRPTPACDAAHGGVPPHNRVSNCGVSAGTTYAVLLKIDAAGEWPVVAGPDTDLHAHAKTGVRWRLVAQTDDVAEAYRLHALLQLQRECREP